MSRRPVQGNLPVYFPTTAPIACRRAVGTQSGALLGQWLSHGDAGETAAEDGAGERNDGRAATDASEGARNAGAGGASSDEWRASSEESEEEANGGVAP